MNPKIMLVLWTLICTVSLVFFSVLIFKLIKKKRMKKNLLVILALGLFLSSCQKEISPEINDKRKILESIGFNLKSVNFDDTLEASKLTPLKFESIEQARNYFKPFIDKFSTATDFKSITANNKLLWDSVKIETLPLPNAVPPADSTVTLQEVVVWTGYQVSFTWHWGNNTSGGGFYSAFGFTSGLTGFHPGVSWTPGIGSYVNYPNSALIYFTVTGTQHYNLFINGIGTLFSQPVILSGIYNINTHAYNITVANAQ